MTEPQPDSQPDEYPPAWGFNRPDGTPAGLGRNTDSIDDDPNSYPASWGYIRSEKL
jgi:hypothetical protein